MSLEDFIKENVNNMDIDEMTDAEPIAACNTACTQCNGTCQQCVSTCTKCVSGGI